MNNIVFLDTILIRTNKKWVTHNLNSLLRKKPDKIRE
jgi:hypothetical protein